MKRLLNSVDAWDLAAAAGAALVVAGVALWSTPAALVLGGLKLLALGIGGARWASSRRS